MSNMLKILFDFPFADNAENCFIKLYVHYKYKIC